ncbi:MAG: GNAT family N-acetyltransferase [Methylococcales bacterium]|nr:GNAT family N-acetyltransferase [Methylococcales bacterium]
MTSLPTQNNPPLSLYQNISFPLNVYAHALMLEEGQLHYLHYGLFKSARTSLLEAQAYSTQLILSQLPKKPAKLLEVGVGLGTTLRILSDKGYQCQGITPDLNQINYLQQQWNNSAPVRCVSLEDFEPASEPFDIILFQESAQYIDPLVIFNQAIACLKNAGSLLILDEFSLNNYQHSENLHALDQFIALAKRAGFELINQQDLSYFAAPTLPYLLNVTQKHKKQLLKDLNLSSEQLQKLGQSNQYYQAKYESGDYGYTLLHFKKTSIPQFLIKMPETDDFKKIQPLFKHCFNEELAAEFWQWKYSDSKSKALCLWKDNTLIAHYGGLSRKILYFSTPQQAVQIGDVMVDPTQRGTSAFFDLAATFLERYIGEGKPFFLGFGFPNDRAMKIAEHFGLYQQVETMGEISWTLGNARPKLHSHLKVINSKTIKAFKPIIDDLWQQMTTDLQTAIVGVRDSNYIINRYLNHPKPIYYIVAVKQRLTQKFFGILVLTFTEQRCDIVDLIAPIQHIPLVMQQAQRVAILHQCTELCCQITQGFSSHFQALNTHYTPLNIRIPTSIWGITKPTVNSIKNRWWLMTGDMDFR